jgi:cytochrome P450
MAAAEPSFVPPFIAPVERPLAPLAFLKTFIRNPLATLAKPVYEQPIFTHRVAGRVTAWICDPPLIERFLLEEANDYLKTPVEKRVFGPTLGDGILTSQGASWKWQRRTAAPLFRVSELQNLIPAMSAAAEAQLAHWRQAPSDHVEAIDHAMTETTFRVISATMFGHAADSESEVIQANTNVLLRWVAWEVGFALLQVPRWVWHPGKLPRYLAAKRTRAAVHKILAHRRSQAADGRISGDDLIARLAAATDPDTGERMSDEQIVDNMLTFLAAGHETTANALTWALYLLAREPVWQERIRAEVTTVAGAAPITAAHLERLVVTGQVVKEAMRLFPPVAIMSRQATRETAIGDLTLPKGAVLVFPIYALHRHQRLWKNPEQFNPNNFAPEAARTHHRAQFMPFGFGPRLCIGMSFAMMEAQAILATLVRGARFDWDGRYVPEPVSRVTLRPKHGMPLVVTTLR